MNPRQITAIALRVIAIFVGINTLRTLPVFFTSSESPGHVYSLFLLGITTVLVLVLWFFPGTIAGRLVNSPNTQTHTSTPPDTWLAMGCALIGVWVLTSAIPSLIYDLFALNALSTYDDNAQVRHWIWRHVVELGIACSLILGGKGLRRVFWWAQNAGIKKAL
jgi:hypothetical protein